MTRFEKITYQPPRKRARTRLVRVIAESSLLLHVHMVAKDGDDVGGRIDKDGTPHDTEHMIDKTLISKRVPQKMNLFFEELEDDTEASK